LKEIMAWADQFGGFPGVVIYRGYPPDLLAFLAAALFNAFI
jgi:hypothetical protein